MNYTISYNQTKYNYKAATAPKLRFPMTLQDQPNARGFETMSIIRNRITISSLQEAPGIRKTFNVNIEENVFVFLLRLYICIYLIVLTTTMMRHFIVSPNPRKMKCLKIFLLHQLYIFMKTHNDQQMTELNFITSTSCYHQQNMEVNLPSL